ncbi:MAG: YbhB/YbcL family Raf kinase inhibitor-like protein [Candidatus Gracilibacteria bacterium]
MKNMGLFGTFAVLVLIVGVMFFTKPGDQQPSSLLNQLKFMDLTSSAFAHNAAIPSVYTCEGTNINPPLAMSNIPAEAKSLAMIVHDPDAPRAGGFTHWVIWNIDPKTSTIAENSVPAGAVQGANGAGENSWMGPCPPSGNHHYEFTLYALDTMLNLPAATDKAGLEKAVEGHVLAKTQLIGLYQKKQQ